MSNLERRATNCGCDKRRRRRWRMMRALLFLAALSLALYMPWKAATQFSSLRDIYGSWFLQGAVVAVAGLLFVIRPAFAYSLPLVFRGGIGLAAALWIKTGVACTPSLIDSIQASLGSGLFATFHMLTQHVFLSLGVLAFVATPQAMASRFVPELEAPTPSRTQPALDPVRR